MLQSLTLRYKQIKSLAGQKIYRAIFGKPKSLGDGLRRVVGRNAKLVGEPTNTGAVENAGKKGAGNLFGMETKNGITTRRYSNGVVLQHGDVRAGRHTEHKGVFTLLGSGDDALAVSKNGEMIAVRQSRTWGSSLNPKEFNWSKDVLTPGNNHYVSRQLVDGKLTGGFTRNHASDEIKDYQEVFRTLAGA